MQPFLHPEAREKKESEPQNRGAAVSKMTNDEQEAMGYGYLEVVRFSPPLSMLGRFPLRGLDPETCGRVVR